MTTTGEQVVARGRALIGVRFRPQGRSDAGVDCIGVVAMVFGLNAVRGDYGLRSSDVEEVEREFAGSGFLRVAVTEAGAGDCCSCGLGSGSCTS